MKKLTILLFVCIMSAMPTFSAVISDNFCVDALSTICLNVNDIRDMANLKGVGNAKADKAINSIINSMNERFGFALDKDFEHIGAFIVPTQSGGIDLIGYVTGNFNSSQKVQVIEDCIQSISKEATIEHIDAYGNVVTTIVDNGYRILFLNQNVILFGTEDTIINVINGMFSFGKAPETVEKVLNGSDSFLLVNGAVLPLLGQIEQIPSEFVTLSNNCINAFVYIKDSKLNFDLAYSNSENANNIKFFADETKNKYLKQNENKLGEATNKLKQAQLKDFFAEAKNMYAAAKALDNLEQITVSKENNLVHITTLYSGTQLTLGAIEVVSALAIPNFKKARETARSKACYSNMRVLLGAVEMYNFDNSVMMTQLDIQKLVESKYLKSEPHKPETGCSYYSEGDLTQDGKIKCKLHGDVPEL